MKIDKSSRHQKIIGNFGENIICNWLSRSGFEVILVDHTGIDVIAYNTSTKQRIGITVKSRTRTEGKETDSVNLFSYQKQINDRQKVLAACEAFSCEPWIAVYVEASDYAHVYLTSLENYDKKYRGNQNKAIDDWKMTKKNTDQYIKDKDVKHIAVQYTVNNWKWS